MLLEASAEVGEWFIRVRPAVLKSIQLPLPRVTMCNRRELSAGLRKSRFEADGCSTGSPRMDGLARDLKRKARKGKL